ncbi:hypothetical protein P5673_000392 [Acropora cervicornis]|uniref:Uncharacterized protein n=1 Tax=Acropora cervicornis TaxID=6130 RepID=A0AAD9R7I5_ACRCE|nr:hypothetical protein P5673_000392 [Acropora cervicornis]
MDLKYKSLVISDAHSSVMMVSPFNADMRAVANDEFKAVGELMACPLFKGGGLVKLYKFITGSGNLTPLGLERVIVLQQPRCNVFNATI